MRRSLGVARVNIGESDADLVGGPDPIAERFCGKRIGERGGQRIFRLGRPGLWSGSMTVVTSSGRSTAR